MRRLLTVVVSAGIGLTVVAQSPVAQSPPPALLPPSITGAVSPTSVIPAAARVPGQPPILRFQNLKELPAETASSVLAMRAASEWLYQRQQPHGRFLFGVNPALRSPLEGDNEFRQAIATWSMCQAASFTGDEKLTACGAQAILSLLSQSREELQGLQGVGFAAATVLAIRSLPSADAKLQAEAQRLTAQIEKQIRADGSFSTESANSSLTNIVPGLALQAMVLGSSSDATIVKSLGHYREKFKAAPHAVLAGSLIPAAVDHALRTKNAVSAAMVFEMADWLCTTQYGKLDARQILWAGAFRTDTAATPTEPDFETAFPARGLAAACQLIRQGVPDLTRYPKYRQATVESLGFLRGLQYSVDNSMHFVSEFRVQYLQGGIRTALTDGNLRADATGLAILAFQRFLESGAELQ